MDHPFRTATPSSPRRALVFRPRVAAVNVALGVALVLGGVVFLFVVDWVTRGPRMYCARDAAGGQCTLTRDFPPFRTRRRLALRDVTGMHATRTPTRTGAASYQLTLDTTDGPLDASSTGWSEDVAREAAARFQRFRTDPTPARYEVDLAHHAEDTRFVLLVSPVALVLLLGGLSLVGWTRVRLEPDTGHFAVQRRSAWAAWIPRTVYAGAARQVRAVDATSMPARGRVPGYTQVALVMQDGTRTKLWTLRLGADADRATTQLRAALREFAA